MALNPELTRSTSMPELPRLDRESLPRNLARSTSLLDVRAPILRSAEPQSPESVSTASSILETEEPHSKVKPKKIKENTKKSNRVSTDKKAKFHLAAIAGAVTIGTVLAPFTLGFSLLPTVFVVMYGNASAIAMYGGSQFVAGDKEKKKAPLEPPKIDPPKDSSPKRPFHFPPLAELPEPKHKEDVTDKDAGRGDTFNNCFNNVNNFHNSWYVFINSRKDPDINLVSEDQVKTPNESSVNNIGTQTTDATSIGRVTLPFADAAEVIVVETPVKERQERLKTLISQCQEQADPQLVNLFNLLLSGDDACAQMVEITGKDGATAYAVIPNGESLVIDEHDRTTGSDVPTPLAGRTTKTATPVATQTDDTPARERGNGSPSMTDDGTQTDVPTAVAQTPTNAGTTARPPVAAKTTNTPVTSHTDGVSTEDIPATVVPEANAVQGYTGRKWDVSSSNPVNLSQGAQTGSNYTQGPRRNLETTPGAAPSSATGHPRSPAAGNGSGTTPSMTDDGIKTDVPTVVADTPTNAGTPARPPVAAKTTNTPVTSQTDGVSTEDTPATVVPAANAVQGYTGRKWEVSSSNPVNLSQGAQTGSNYTQGPRRNLETTPGAAPSSATANPRGLAAGNGSGTTPSMTDDGIKTDVPTAVAQTPTNAGTTARPPVAAKTTNTPVTSHTDGVSTEDTPATVVPEANAAQGYTGRKWDVSSSNPVNLSQGAQTGSNYTQGPRRNLETTPGAAPSSAAANPRGLAAGNGSGTTPSMTDDGIKTDVPTAVAQTPTNAGTTARPPVAAKTTNTPVTSHTDGVSTEDTPATVVPEANAAQGYTGRKWDVSSSNPVNLSQGAQTGSNYTQGPRRNLETTPGAAPSSAAANPRSPAAGNSSGTTPSMTDDGIKTDVPTPLAGTTTQTTTPVGTQTDDIPAPEIGNGSPSVADVTDDGTQTDVPTVVADTPTNAGTPARPPVAAKTTNTPVTSQTDGVSTEDTPATVVPAANAVQGYTGRKWEVSSSNPVNLSQGAQTGSNYTQGPRRNLGTTPSAAPSSAAGHPRGLAAGNGSGTTPSMTDDGIKTDVPTAVAQTPTNAGTTARPPVAAKTTNTPVTSQTDGMSTEDTPATVVPAANAAQGYTGRTWKLSSSTPVNLSQGAQTGSNYTQGPRRNLETTPGAAPSLATGNPRGPAAGNGSGTTPPVMGNGSPSMTDDGIKTDVPTAVAGTPTNAGTTARPPVAAKTTNTPVTSQTDGMSTEDTPATVVPAANAVQGYTGSKWDVSSSNPVNLSQGAQTGSNYTQGPRRNLETTSGAAPSSATANPRSPAAGNGSGTTPSMTDDGIKTDVPTAVAGTPARPPVAAKTTNTPVTSHTDGMSTEDTPATVVPAANAVQGYTGSKWDVSSSNPVNLSQGAQTGSNYTQGPRRNLETTSGAAPSSATANPRSPAAGNGSGTTPSMTDDGTQTDVSTVVADTPTKTATPVATQTDNTPAPEIGNGSPSVADVTDDGTQTDVPTPLAGTTTQTTTPVGTQTDDTPAPEIGNGSPSVADVTDDGTQTDVPTAVAQTPTNAGTTARPPVAAKTTNTPVTSQTDGMSTEDTPATVVPAANAVQGYTGRKWDLSSSNPVNLSQGAQTGSNYTQGPRRNLETTPDAAPSSATGHSSGQADGDGSGKIPPVMGNGSPSVADVTDDGTQTDVPTPLAGTTTQTTTPVGTQTDDIPAPEIGNGSPSVADVTDDGTQTDVPTVVADTPTNEGTPARPPVAAKTTNTPTTSQTDGVSTEDTPATVVPAANAVQGYTGRKWDVSSSNPVNLSQGAQTGSNYTQGPRRNLGTTPSAAPSSAAGHPSGQADGNGRGKIPPVMGNSSSSVVDGELLAGMAATSVNTLTNVPTETTDSDITAESQKSAVKPLVDLGKIESRIVGRAGGHIQHRVPKFLDRPEAGTLMGSWRPIPESLRGKKDSAEFEEWRKQDLGQYVKSLNSKVLLTQGATSMRGQNHFAGKLNNLKDRAEIKSLLNPVNRMSKSDYQQISGLDLVSTGRSNLLGSASGKLIVTPPLVRSNLVLAP